MNNIHPTAFIGKNVILGNNVTILPYTVLDGNIEIGDDCIMGPSAHIKGWVKVGSGTQIHSFSTIGDAPQDYSFDGTPGLVEIGRNCIIREGVTIHTPVHGDEGEKTSIGNNVFLMVNSHVGHNSKVGDNSILVNGTLLAGYVTVEENVVTSGNVAIHQFCRVGAFVMIGGLSKVVQDVPPFIMTDGNPAIAHGINAVGLKRKGFGQEERTIIKNAYKILYSGKARAEALEEMLREYPNNKHILRIVEFVKASKRGIIGYHEE